MNYMILSDIHGSESYLDKALHLFEEKGYDYLILLGDLLYHGPRNPLPEGHNPQGVVQLLNFYASKIIACGGNCDAQVDQMLLNFPCLSDYALIFDEGVRLFTTHGHLYTPENFPRSEEKNIFLYGHTHLWELKKEGPTLICNPGSISLPKENRPPTYAVYSSSAIAVYSLDGQLLAAESL